MINTESQSIINSLNLHQKLLNLSRNEFKKEIEKQLSHQLDYAIKNVKYYREKYQNIHWNYINAFEKLTELGYVDKTTLRNYGMNFLSDNIKKDESIIRSSSGSSGFPTFVYKDASLFSYYSAVLINKMLSHGWTPFETYFIMHGDGIGNVKPGISVKNFAHLLELGNPSIIYSYPSYLVEIAKKFPNKIKNLKLRFIGTHSEQSTMDEQEFISSRFNCNVYDDYGMTEVGLIAFQCPKHNYHIIEDNVYLEVISESGQRCHSGEIGEIVITDLRNKSMPLLRYKTGDLGILEENKSCDCSYKNFGILNKIVGRKEDSFILPDNTIIPSGQLIAPLGFPPSSIHNWQVVQMKKDLLRIYIVKGNKFNEDDINNFIRTLKDIIKLKSVCIEVEYSSEIRRINGKYKVFHSMLHE